MPLGIDPKVDYAFKWVFGDQRNAPLLIHLLNAILDLEVPIAEVEILNPFNPKESAEDKLTVLDVKARDDSGRRINVEMQLLLPQHFCNRILFYWAGMYREQLSEGDVYGQLSPVISICLVNEILFSGHESFHTSFRLLDAEHGTCFSDDMQIHVVEFPKFREPVDNLSGPLEKWVYLLQHAEHLNPDVLPEAINDSVYDHAMREWQMLTQSERERELYEARMKAIRDQQGLFDRGREEGCEAGMLIGKIHVCEDLLGRPVTPRAELQNLKSDELARLAEDLQEQLRERQV